MTPLLAFVLAALLSAPKPHGSLEEDAARRARSLSVASELTAAVDLRVMTGRFPGAERHLWAAAAAATAIRESGGLRRSVHSGKRLGDRGGSTCFMQINRGNPVAYDTWDRLAGLDEAATRRCADAGVESLAHLRAFCARRVPRRRLLAATLSAYTTGNRCDVTREGMLRAELTRKLLRLRQRENNALVLAAGLGEPIAVFDGGI